MNTTPKINNYLESKKSKLSSLVEGRISTFHVEKQQVEEFSAKYIAGNLTIQSKNFLGEAFALNQLYAGLASGYLAEVTENRQPMFSIRPLWLVGSCPVKVTESLGCCVSSQLLEFDTQEKQVQLCHRLIEMGYNALIIGGLCAGHSGEVLSYPLYSLAETLASWGLKLIIKPEITGDFCPLSEKERNAIQGSLSDLQKVIPALYGILWESRLLHPSYAKHKKAKDALIYDLVVQEVQLIEKSLSPTTHLIFYLPAETSEDTKKQAEWFLSLSDEVGKNTILAFPAIAGNPIYDHQLPHPFWEILRNSVEVIHTPLMPIANFGSVGLGEGLWPTPPLQLLNLVFQRCERHHFAGIASLSSSVPSESGFLDCVLWSAGHLMWGKIPPQLVLEKWFKAYRPDLNFSKFFSVFLEMDMIRISLGKIKEDLEQNRKNETINDELRLVADSLLPRLNQIFHLLEAEERKNAKRISKPSLYDYFIYFARDARRIILYAMQSANLSISGLSHEMDSKESFWTSYGQGESAISRSNGSIALLTEPLKGNSGSKMRQIYDEKFIKTLSGETHVHHS